MNWVVWKCSYCNHRGSQPLSSIQTLKLGCIKPCNSFCLMAKVVETVSIIYLLYHRLLVGMLPHKTILLNQMLLMCLRLIWMHLQGLMWWKLDQKTLCVVRITTFRKVIQIQLQVPLEALLLISKKKRSCHHKAPRNLWNCQTRCRFRQEIRYQVLKM